MKKFSKFLIFKIILFVKVETDEELRRNQLIRLKQTLRTMAIVLIVFGSIFFVGFLIAVVLGAIALKH